MDNNKVKQSQLILKIVFSVVPIVAGLDKFTNILVDWTQYIPPFFASMLPFSPQTFMYIVGVIEIIAGILVFTRTRLGALIVAAWLVLIAISVALAGYYDIAVRDVVMATGAVTLANLTAAISE
jgi:uncharacterized membrane protein YphA (DoxX/SURF4 family)